MLDDEEEESNKEEVAGLSIATLQLNTLLG
jgi:hypothetical protein